MVDADYKSAKESFVSDQTGSTQTHINLISLIAFTSLCLYSALRTRVRGFPPKAPLALFGVQFVLLVLPPLGAVTYAAQGPGLEALQWNACFILGALLVWMRFEPKMQRVRESLPNSSPNPSRMEFPNEIELKEQRQKVKRSQESKDAIPKLQAVTTWRAHMMLMTVICILAVDFPVFPRSLAKCETFGVSMMDMGVGAFVFASGISSSLPLLRDPNHLSGSIIPKVLRSIKKTSPLIFIGLVRLMLVKSTDYPGEHVSEYGTHWNFFLTLAVIPPLQMALHPVFQFLSVTVVGLGVAVVHQLFLSFTSLQDWALYASRVDLFTHNKEGIVSIPGYLAIHLLGLSTGLLILPPTPSHFRRSSTKKVKSNNASSSDDDEAYAKDAWVDETKAPEKKPLKRDDGKTAIELCSYGVLYAVLFIASKLIASEDDISRRLANLQYVLWVTTYNVFFILLYILHDIFFYPSPNRKPRATDTAAQHGPTAPQSTSNNDEIWASSTALANPITSGSTLGIDYGKRPSLDSRHSTSSVRPGSRQGYLTVDSQLSDTDDYAGEPLKKKKSARRSWDGSDLRVGDAGGGDEGRKYGTEYSRDGTSISADEVLGRDVEVVKRTSPEILDAINKNGLVVFLLANVLTGLINFSIQTIYTPDSAAMVILSTYLLVLCAFAWTFRDRRLLTL